MMRTDRKMLGKTTYPPLLRQLKSGAWVFGAGSAPVPDDWTWSIDLPSIYRGWVCQPHMPGDHAPLAEVMATVVEHRPARPEPVVGGDWREQWELMPRCLASEHNIKGSYKTASTNGLGRSAFYSCSSSSICGSIGTTGWRSSGSPPGSAGTSALSR